MSDSSLPPIHEAIPPTPLELEATARRQLEVADFIKNSFTHARQAHAARSAERGIKRAEDTRDTSELGASIARLEGESYGAESLDDLREKPIDEILLAKKSDLHKKGKSKTTNPVEDIPDKMPRKAKKVKRRIEGLAIARDNAAIKHIRSVQTLGSANRGEIDKKALRAKLRAIKKDGSLNALEKKAALLEARVKADRKPTKAQLESRQDLLRTERNLSRYVESKAVINEHAAKKARERVVTKSKQRATALEKRDTIKVAREIKRVQRAETRATRGYNRRAAR